MCDPQYWDSHIKLRHASTEKHNYELKREL